MKSNIIPFIFKLLILLLFYRNCFSVPTITGTSSATVSEKSVITISGNGFTNPGDKRAFSDKVFHNVDGTDENKKITSGDGWKISPGGVRSDIFSISDANVRTPGTKVMKGSMHSNNGPFDVAVSYDFGQALQPQSILYFTYWTKMESTGGPKGQWKLFRISNADNIVDHTGELVLFHWHNVQNLAIRHSKETGLGFGAGGNPLYPLLGDGEWSRVEVELKTSNKNVTDGYIKVILHDRTRAVVPQEDVSILFFNGWTINALETYGSNSDYYRYLILQNFVGNDDFANVASDVYMDDIYIQIGSVARVELCNTNNWATCTYREIQYPTNWKDGEIEVQINVGEYTNGEKAYLFVIDEDGNVSNSFEVTIENVPPKPGKPSVVSVTK